MADFAEDLVGRVVQSVSTEDDGKLLIFEFLDGVSAVFSAEGDCCSRSWISSLDFPPDVSGAVITEVPEGYEYSNQYEVDNNHPEYDCLRYYKTVFRTNRGDITVEYRNSSNGYYGGSLDRVK